jgi:hypothetical protein
MRSFKFLRNNLKYSEEEEHNARILLMRLVMTGEYETTVYPKVYDNQHIVHNVTTTIRDNSQYFVSNISHIGGGTYNINLSI